MTSVINVIGLDVIVLDVIGDVSNKCVFAIVIVLDVLGDVSDKCVFTRCYCAALGDVSNKCD